MKDLNQNQPKSANALEELGYAFIKIPRRLSWQLFHGPEDDRQIARIYLALFCSCAYQDGPFTLGGKLLRRQKGQWIGTIEQLVEMTSVSRHRIRVALEKLNEDKWVRIEHIFRGLRVTVISYAEFTGTEGKAKAETPEERTAREYCEMIDKLNRGTYV